LRELLDLLLTVVLQIRYITTIVHPDLGLVGFTIGPSSLQLFEVCWAMTSYNCGRERERESERERELYSKAFTKLFIPKKLTSLRFHPQSGCINSDDTASLNKKYEACL
jgi:hypothetical protein